MTRSQGPSRSPIDESDSGFEQSMIPKMKLLPFIRKFVATFPVWLGVIRAFEGGNVPVGSLDDLRHVLYGCGGCSEKEEGFGELMLGV